jgi:hypothetical protein
VFRVNTCSDFLTSFVHLICMSWGDAGRVLGNVLTLRKVIVNLIVDCGVWSFP